ncbi:tetratricopeptide repeat, partial [Paramuricea clavata]
LDAVNDDYNNNSVQNSNSSDGAQLHDKTVDNVEQKDIKSGSIADKIAPAEQLLILGRSYQTEGRIEEAIKSYDQAVLIVDETDHGNNIKAKAYQLLGNVFTGTSEYMKAIEYYQKAREIHPSLEADEIEVVAYQWLGYNHLQAGQYQESIEYYNEVVKLASQLGCKTREVNATLNPQKIVSLTQLSNLKAKEISHDLGDKKEETNACLMLGDTFELLKQYGNAAESYQKALNISKELKDKEVQANAVQKLGSISFNIGEYEEALKYSKILVELIENPDHRGIKQALAQKRLGMCYAYLGRFEEGLTCFKKALKLVCNHSEKAVEGVINEWCGYCSRFITGKDQEAITFYEKTKTIAKQVGKKYEEYRSNQAIGNILSNTGDYLKAKEYYEQAMDIALELSDKHCEATSCLNLASVCSKDCDYEMARKWYEKALDILGAERNDHLLHEKALTGSGVTLFNLGDTKKAIKLIQEAQTFAKNKNDTDCNEAHSTHAQEKSPRQKTTLLQVEGKFID